jgi:polygalacturonase
MSANASTGAKRESGALEQGFDGRKMNGQLILTRRAFASGAAAAVLIPNRAFAAAGASDKGADVRRFGAAGDGVRDDTASFAAALGASATL